MACQTQICLTVSHWSDETEKTDLNKSLANGKQTFASGYFVTGFRYYTNHILLECLMCWPLKNRFSPKNSLITISIKLFCFDLNTYALPLYPTNYLLKTIGSCSHRKTLLFNGIWVCVFVADEETDTTIALN